MLRQTEQLTGGKSITQNIDKYVSTWRTRCYKNDIPDSVPQLLLESGRAPSYRAIALAILKNDHALRTLGFAAPTSSYYHELKVLKEVNDMATKRTDGTQVEPRFVRFIPSETLEEPDIKVVPIGSVRPWKKNPRKNSTSAPKLASVIRQHGQRTPVVVWRKTGEVMKGNTTLKAMKMLGMKNIRVQYEDFDDETAAAAYAIADNKSSEWGEWDHSVLIELLSTSEQIQATSGFSAKELVSLLRPEDILPTKKAQSTKVCPKCGYTW